MRLPAVVEELIRDVVADGFTLYCCGPKTAPNTGPQGGHRRPRGRGLGLSRPTTTRDAGVTRSGAPCPPRRPHPQLPRTPGLAGSPSPATPDDDPTAHPSLYPSTGATARHRDNHPQSVIVPHSPLTAIASRYRDHDPLWCRRVRHESCPQPPRQLWCRTRRTQSCRGEVGVITTGSNPHVIPQGGARRPRRWL